MTFSSDGGSVVPAVANNEVSISPIKCRVEGKVGCALLITAGRYKLVPMNARSGELATYEEADTPARMQAMGDMLQAVRIGNPNVTAPRMRAAVDEFIHPERVGGWAVRILITPDGQDTYVVLLVVEAGAGNMAPMTFADKQLAMIHAGEVLDVLSDGYFNWQRVTITDNTIS